MLRRLTRAIYSSAKMAHKHWGYCNSELPPNNWFESYPDAKGEHQSPINIETGSCKKKDFPAFQLKYDPVDVKSVNNNGHSVTFVANGGKSVLSGGPLKSKYTLEQFHFHWGSDSTQGSEHTLNGKPYAAELHLVHWNSDKYKSFADSCEHSDGLCVLGALLEAGETENSSFAPVLDNIRKVPFKGNDSKLSTGFQPRDLLPDDLSRYYHYGGSLTTPPLKECVQWIVFSNPVVLSEKQLSVFRSLHFGEHEGSPYMCNNYRPVQKLGKRHVLTCSANQ